MNARRFLHFFGHALRPNLKKTPAARPLSLAQARCGELLKIVSLRSDSPSCHRLRELGFCELCEVLKISDNGALICNLLGCRVAIGRELGAQILVERVRA